MQPALKSVPDSNPESNNQVADAVKAIKKMSGDKQITADQERIATYALSKNSEFALLANRILNQSADPESIRLLNPKEFKAIAEILGMTEEDAQLAIEASHKSGPAGLTDNSKEEDLWLLLASLSSQNSDTLADRLMNFAKSITGMREMAKMQQEELKTIAVKYKQKIIDTIVPVAHTENGIPIYKDQLGFFAAYRQGFKAAMVDSGSRRMVGTTPDTSLDEQGLKVDKKLSEQFGIRMSRY